MKTLLIAMDLDGTLLSEDHETISARNREALRAASERGGAIAQLCAIPVREKIGRAKSVPADQYKDTYTNLLAEMEEEITAIAEKGEDEL